MKGKAVFLLDLIFGIGLVLYSSQNEDISFIEYEGFFVEKLQLLYLLILSIVNVGLFSLIDIRILLNYPIHKKYVLISICLVFLNISSYSAINIYAAYKSASNVKEQKVNDANEKLEDITPEHSEAFSAVQTLRDETNLLWTIIGLILIFVRIIWNVVWYRKLRNRLNAF